MKSKSLKRSAREKREQIRFEKILAATTTKKELKSEYGTPEQFEDRVWRACNDGYCTAQEAAEAIAEYEKEWRLAK